jgi:NADH-quinone oxidoreductase subunit L
MIFALSMVLIPVGAGFLLLLGKFENENTISTVSLAAVGMNFLVMIGVSVGWLVNGCAPIDLFLGPLIKVGEYRFDLSFQIDTLTVTFLFLISFIGGVSVKYSQYYMHREPGYRRFFVNILFFLGGMCLLALAGNLDLLFAGWEMVGISSVLLIAFYRERDQPARNALKTYTVYRFCDTGVLLGAYLSHLLWHVSPTFSDLDSPSLRLLLQSAGEAPLLWLTLLIALAASGKSAQFPFTFWIPRAMEGPTPSSAVFYGSLSIHAGAFLLMRMYPVWHASYYGPFLIGAIGAFTAVFSSLVGRGQTSIKGQIAYASSAQVGLIFFELALGLRGLALFHLVCNCLLRCLQLLVSPSILAFVMQSQGAGGPGRVFRFPWKTRLVPTWTASLYVFGLCEGYVEEWMRLFVWRPVRKLGGHFGNPLALVVWFAALLACLAFKQTAVVGALLVLAALMLSFFAVGYAGDPRRPWTAAALSGVLIAASIALQENEALWGLALTGINTAVGWSLGMWALTQWSGPGFGMDQYHGRTRQDTRNSGLLFVGFLLLAGFPIGPGFFAEDVLLHSTVKIGWWYTTALGAVFVFNGVALCRVFVRCCFGSGPVSSIAL